MAGDASPCLHRAGTRTHTYLLTRNLGTQLLDLLINTTFAHINSQSVSYFTVPPRAHPSINRIHTGNGGRQTAVPLNFTRR